METLIIIGIIFLAVLVIAGPVAFLKFRRASQEDVAYERSLEMVPVLIHLPPLSEDTETNGRDLRDIVDENISKAQIIYNIIASTTQKNFKNWWHGQRHFGFEIIGTKGFVNLYAAVPADMIDVLKQAVTSAYPSARLQEVAEHNIFNEIGGVNGVVGGEFNLKESFAYPIATYQDLKRDALQSLLNAMSALDTIEGAAIQILFRPAESGWRKKASLQASQKRKGSKSMSASILAREVVTAFVKPPETKPEGGDKPKELSALEQSVLDSIDDKTRHPGFEVAIRVVASSNITQRAQAIVNNIVASFSLFDAPGKNGFKFEQAKDPAKLASEYVLRVVNRSAKRNILNSVELATLFHFPDQRSIPTSQLERQESKQVDGPRNMPNEGLLLGFNVFRGVKKPVRLGLKDRQRHMYAVGQTGTGKSTFLENLALQDMLSGDGFAFVDPHGDTVEKLLAMVPKERTEDVIYFSPGDMDFPMGLNLFEFNNPDQKDFLIQEAISMLYKLYDPQHQGILGPRYENLFRNAALTVMADPAGGTFIDIPKLFRDPQFVKQKLQHVTDPNVREFWEKEMPQSQKSNEFGEVVSWFVSKFGAFLSNEMMRNIIGQTKSAFDLRYIMDNKKILLVNLSKGRLGDLNSKLLGMMFVMKFQAAAMSRSDTPEDNRQDFALYVDEFQNFSTDSFATIMSEARKYHLNLIVANQFTTQLTDEIRDAVFGNIGTIVSFRIGQNDVEALSRYFQPQFDGDDLLRVPNYNSIVRTLINGVPTQSFSMATLPPLGNPNPHLSDALKQLSAAKYGKPKAVVEKSIFARLETKVPPQPAAAAGAKPFQNPFTSPQAGAGVAPPRSGYSTPGVPQQRPAGPPPTSRQGSFLDEWLAKQRAMAPTPTLGSAPAPAAHTVAPTPGFEPAQPFSASNTRPVHTGDSQPLSTSQHHVMAGAQPGALRPLKYARENEIIAEQNDMAGQGGNVSSTQIDKREIDSIASELKKGLRSDVPLATAGTVVPTQPAAPVPAAAPAVAAPDPLAAPLQSTAAPATAAPVQPPLSATEGTVHLNPRPAAVRPEEDDTIAIDADGNLVLQEDTESPKP
ncbi:MAG TPA: ATP-binding protein [Candidatus Saccharimonadales bacterium]|nr:ATP-binding protein [Candidatus Saccharimonadales bacterium]